MIDLRIARLRKRYRLPEATARDDRARLDRVLAAAIDDELIDAALERAGIPATDEICIRHVASSARLNTSDPDARLAVQWSIAIADAIAAAIAWELRAGGPGVVRFGSRHQALVHMMCSAAGGDLSRAWAWRQLGIWNASDALSPTAAIAEAVEALSREPRAAPAVLRAVAAAGLLPVIVTGASTERWMRLARAALIAFDASASMLAALEEALEDALPSPTTASAPRATVDRIAAGSAILRSVSRIGRAPVAARAIAVLAVLECEPELATSGQSEIIRALADRIVTTLTGASEARHETTPQRTNVSDKATVKSSASVATHAAAPDVSHPSDDAPVDERARAITAYGGLLFLLHIVRALSVPALPDRSLRWTLHRLALTLVALEPNDPAALAFSGLAPGSRPPSEDEPAETEAERMELSAVRSTLVESLRARLDPPLDESDDALVLRIVTRTAEIVADPAWIEVRFSMADATTDVRRAALDFDPGWIPWLGVVVRFAYV